MSRRVPATSARPNLRHNQARQKVWDRAVKQRITMAPYAEHRDVPIRQRCAEIEYRHCCRLRRRDAGASLITTPLFEARDRAAHKDYPEDKMLKPCTRHSAYSFHSFRHHCCGSVGVPLPEHFSGYPRYSKPSATRAYAPLAPSAVGDCSGIVLPRDRSPSPARG